MHFVLLAGLSLLVSTSALVEVESLVGYHERVGIPAATRIKEAEEKILAAQAEGSRIVGGSVAPSNEHPYLAGLLITFFNVAGTSACGSSLVSSNRLVTAAHCWFDGRFQANQFVVVLGSHFLFSGGIRIPTSNVVVHPWWSPATLQNDVAVIYLPTHVSLSATVQPIQLPHGLLWERFIGEWAVAAGYGRTSDQQVGISVNAVVSHVSLQVISEAQCSAVFGHWAQPSNICTNGVGGVGVCNGDSGGPLYVTRNGQRILVGISSFVAAAGCQLGFPSAFARVTSFYSFIMQHM
ncbi:brachyurin-like [Epargyreus clarus]|uniref:brachyurin-like n=1 Tax=Epargyreus clarus TaxID=520877 RepID=UPI003C306DEA